MRETWAPFWFVIKTHLFGIAFFTLFRIILFFYNAEQTVGIESKTALFFCSLLKGLQFDSQIASYITALPLITVVFVYLKKQIANGLINLLKWYYTVIYAILFGLAAADIPYFKYFLSHLKYDVLGWMKFASTTAGMIFEDAGNYPFMALLIATVVAFYFIINHNSKKLILYINNCSSWVNTVSFVSLFLVLFIGTCIGMRGSFNRYPLRTGDAYFCNYSFFNQLGVNPAFAFIKSIEEKSKKHMNVNNLMSAEDALVLMNKELGIERDVKAEGNPTMSNVVIILLESLASECLKREFNGKALMPFLNSLADSSYNFVNFYSAGVHTNNGIVSTLFGTPAFFDRPSIENNSRHFNGLPQELKKYGYQTMFFITGNPNYDNMLSFLLENDFDNVYSQFDYPKNKIVNNFGVQDDFLLEYSLERLNEVADEGKPFLSVMLTVSNHPPFVIPEAFNNAADKDQNRILAFVDHSVQSFMVNAAKQEWYKNTIFVLLGDHGGVWGQQPYAMPLTYNHIFCIIASPLLKDAPRRFEQFGGQIDIFPTIMGLLNFSYNNESMGIDILSQKRPCMFFVSNNHLGCINQYNFYVRDLESNTDFLYDLHDEQPNNIAASQPDSLMPLKQYAVGMIVAAEQLY